MSENKYAVIMTHDFDPETQCVVFEDYDKARAYLHWILEDYYNEEIAEGSILNEHECYHEDEYAQVVWGDGCKTEFRLTYVTEPSQRFRDVDWKRYV